MSRRSGSAARAIFSAAGSPPQPGDTAGDCRLCGEAGIGQPWADWVKDTFTDWDKLWPGTIVCHACLFCTDDHNVTLQERTGRDKPQRMRNYSHIVTRDGVWHPLMKNQKREIAALLQADPAMAVISLAGQKHVILRAQPAWWQVEEHALAPCPDQLRHLLAVIEPLYGAGASKAEIESGQYDQRTLLKIGLARWRTAEALLQPHRRTLVCQLAVWLAQKPEDDHDRDTRSGDDAAGRDLARDPARLQGEIQVRDLAAVREPGAVGGLYDEPEPVPQPDLFTPPGEPARARSTAGAGRRRRRR